MKILLIHQNDHTHGLLAHQIRMIPRVKELVLWDGDSSPMPNTLQMQGIVIASGQQTAANIEEWARFVHQHAPEVPLLGIGTGMLAMARAFNLSMEAIATPVFAEQQKLFIGGGESPIFKGISRELSAGCYHRWRVKSALPNTVVATAKDPQGNLFAIRHVKYSSNGVLFNPASTLTPQGGLIINNWLLSL